MDLSVGIIFVISFVLAWMLIGFFLRTSIGAYFTDVPNHRSAHVEPVSRIGGLGLVPVALGLAFVSVSDAALSALCVIGLALMVVSLIDDRIGLPALLRLMVHIAAGVVAVWFSQQSGLLVVVILVGAITWMTNLFNFMDGADGLAGGMSVAGFGAFAVAAGMSGDVDLFLMCGLIVSASLGFLVWNFPPAKMFLGDCGSIPLGFLAAGVGVIGFERGAWSAIYPVLVFLPFIFDATLTLVRRLIAGKNLMMAHREHVYQKLSGVPGWTKRRLALASYGLMTAIVGSAVLVEAVSRGELVWSGALLLVWLVVLSLIAFVTETSVARQAAGS